MAELAAGAALMNSNQNIMRPTVKLRVAYRVADCARLAIPQPTECQHNGNAINIAMIFTGGISYKCGFIFFLLSSYSAVSAKAGLPFSGGWATFLPLPQTRFQRSSVVERSAVNAK